MRNAHSSQPSLLTAPVVALDIAGGLQRTGSHIHKIKHKHPDAAWALKGQPHNTVLEVAWFNESVERLVQEIDVWFRRCNAKGSTSGTQTRQSLWWIKAVGSSLREATELQVWRVGEEAAAAEGMLGVLAKFTRGKISRAKEPLLQSQYPGWGWHRCESHAKALAIQRSPA